MLFGFGIGVNVTQAVFLGSPSPVGFGLTPFAVSGLYGTPMVCSFLVSLLRLRFWLNIPQVAVLIGELIGRYLNDWIMDVSIRRNKGVHEAESRLWYITHFFWITGRPDLKSVSHRACYLALVLYVSGFVVLGAAFQKKLSIGAVIMGWGISVVAIMINTVAICKWICPCTIPQLNSILMSQMHMVMTASPRDRSVTSIFASETADGFEIGWN